MYRCTLCSPLKPPLIQQTSREPTHIIYPFTPKRPKTSPFCEKVCHHLAFDESALMPAPEGSDEEYLSTAKLDDLLWDEVPV